MPDQSYTEAFNTAVRLAQAGQKQAAHEQLSKLNLSHPDDPNLLLWLAFTSDDLISARVLIYRVRNISPQNPSLPQALQWLANEEAQARSKPVSVATPIVPPVAAPAIPPATPKKVKSAPKAAEAKDDAKPETSGPWWAQEEKEDDEKEVPEPSPWRILTHPLVLLVAGMLIILGLVFTVILPTFFSSDPSGGQGVVVPFNFHLVAADYSSSLDRLILVSDNPNQLHIYDPASQKDTTVDLPRVPLNLAVSNDGKFAAVGHSGLISYIDLQKAQLTKKLDLPADPATLVIGNGVVYATAPVASDKTNIIYAIQISGNKQLATDIAASRIGSVMRISPDGKSLYSIIAVNPNYRTDGLTTLGHANFDGSGVPHFLYASSSTVQYSPCDNVWINEDSNELLTACGNVFQATHSQDTDMKYSGKLGDLTSIYNLTTSKIRNEIFAISANIPDANQSVRLPNSNQIQVFDYKDFTFERSFILPSRKVGNSYYESRAQAIFVNKTGTYYYAIVRTADGSGAPNDAGYVSNALPAPTATVAPTK